MRRLIEKMRGDWELSRFRRGDYVLILWAVVVGSLLRAGYYIRVEVIGRRHVNTSKATRDSLGLLESIVPLSVWAGLLILGAALLGAGVSLRRHRAVWLGHAVLAIVFSTLSLSVLLTIITRGTLVGIGGLGTMLVLVPLNWIAWLRTGPTPLRLEEASANVTRRTE